MRTAIIRVELRQEQDVVSARSRARIIAEQLGFDKIDQTRISIAVSEIARNAFQYAGGGEIEFLVDTSMEPHVFAITVRDHGKGIPRLDEVLEGRYVSETGLGLGIIGSKRLVDHFHIDTLPGKGTTVFLGKNLPVTALQVTPALLTHIADVLVKTAAPNPLDEIRLQNQDLIRTLEELRLKQEELVTINRELDDTNRGVVALYAELDDKTASLRAFSESLETRVEERTSELQKANRELKNAKEELNKQFDELAERDKLLAESEERFRISAQSVNDVIWDWNIFNGRLDWYGQIDAILGYAPGEFPRTREAWEQIIHPDDRDRIIAVLERHVKTQTSYAAEYRVVLKDGEIHYWTDKGTAMQDKNGKAYRMVGSCSDITERKLAEEALRQKNEEMDGYFTYTLDLLCIADADGHFRRLNREWESALGYSPAELEGKRFLDFVHPDDMKASLGAMAELKAGKQVLQFTNRYRHRDGSYRWIEWRLFPAGDLIYGSARDITERKKMTDLVEASLAGKETMLREIHHRVKNNLQIISSLLSLQIRKISDPRTIEALRDSQSRVLSMALVHEHLYKGEDFSRIGLKDYIHALGTNLFQSYKAADESIRFEQEIPEIYVDINTAIPLGLIINELITNSLKYAFKEKKEGLLSITATEDAQSLNIIVGDNGSGMPGGITLENQTSLGLRLVSTLTKQLHGTVVIDRSEGTKFVFTVPKPAEIPGKERLVSTLTSRLPGTVAVDRTEGAKFVFTVPKPAETPGKAGQ